MKDKNEIVSNWLPRYTGLPLEAFGEHILLTNFGGYLHSFARLTGATVVGLDRPMPSATSDGITMINFGMGSASWATWCCRSRRSAAKAPRTTTCRRKCRRCRPSRCSA